MSDRVSGEIAPEVVIELYASDGRSKAIVEECFAEDEVLEAHAFTGGTVFSIIAVASLQTIAKLLDFLGKHRSQFRDAKLRIGPKEISLQGCSVDEMQKLLESSGFRELIGKVVKR